MTDPNDITAEDAQLLAELQEALAAARPVPEGRVELAEMTFAWRTIDEELAELAFDSAEELMAVRADTTVRTLSFELDNLQIDLQINVTARTVIGRRRTSKFDPPRRGPRYDYRGPRHVQD